MKSCMFLISAETESDISHVTHVRISLLIMILINGEVG